jgi:hypothetical protein
MIHDELAAPYWAMLHEEHRVRGEQRLENETRAEWAGVRWVRHRGTGAIYPVHTILTNSVRVLSTDDGLRSSILGGIIRCLYMVDVEPVNPCDPT